MSVKQTRKRFQAGIVSGSDGYTKYGTGVTRKAMSKAKPRNKTAQQRYFTRGRTPSGRSSSGRSSSGRTPSGRTPMSPGSRRRRDHAKRK